MEEHDRFVPSGSERVDCPVADACGGCALIGLPYGEQLERKAAAVRSALAGNPDLARVRVEDCRPSPRRTAYRNRAKLAVAAGEGAVAAGLHRPGTNTVVDLAPCRVQGPRSLAALVPLKDWLRSHGLAAPQGPVKHLDLREAAGEALHLTLVVDREPDAPLPLDELAAALPSLGGISLNVNPARSSYVFGERTRTPWGARSFTIEVAAPDGAALPFEVPATGFFQVSTGLLPWIHDTMAKHLGRRGALLDLYCGAGVHGLMVALRGGDGEAFPHDGVEEHVAAAACARRNADRLKVAATFHGGRVERVVPRIAGRRAFERVILNPGRAGCRPAVLEALEPGPGTRLAYLSCEPRTLARDLGTLAGAGWALRRVTPLDLIPQTDQVETLALLDGGIRTGNAT